MTKKASFLEHFMKKYELNAFCHVLDLAENDRNKSASFPASTWEGGHFLCFLFKQIFVDLLVIARKDH